MGRRLDWPDCRNTRDLGGVPRGVGITTLGRIVRSDNISSLTPAGVQAMWQYGVNTVIDLRSESEVRRSPSPFEPAEVGPVYINVPLVDDTAAASVGDIPRLPERYLGMIDGCQASLGRIFTTIARADGPLVFHCFAGKDRAGLVAAMLLSLAGADRDAIASDYAESDLHLAGRYQEWLASVPPERAESMRDELRCPPEWMLGALDHIDTRWGGLEPYLSAAGVGPADIERLESRLAG